MRYYLKSRDTSNRIDSQTPTDLSSMNKSNADVVYYICHSDDLPETYTGDPEEKDLDPRGVTLPPSFQIVVPTIRYGD